MVSRIGKVKIANQMVLAAFIGILVTAVYVIWFLKTRTGLIIRAISQNLPAATLMGASVNRMYYLAMILSVIPPTVCMLVIAPFDKKAIKSIETAILKSELGLNPANDGNVIRLPIPPLNEERRRELTRVVSRMGEEIKTAVRNVRRDANEEVKKLEKDKHTPLSEDAAKKALEQIQKITDEAIKEVDETVKHKEAEIMHV